MNRIAIISDIHGNREALKTAIKDIQKRKCDKIICLGDIIDKGYFSNECLEIIKKSCDIILRGNCDDYYSKDGVSKFELSDEERKRIINSQKKISPENREFLANLPFCYEFYLSGRLVRTFHAGPDSIYNYSTTSPYANIEKKAKMFEPNILTISNKSADIVIYGHMHIQCMTKLYNRTLICCGSIGNSLDTIRNEQKDGNILNTTSANYLIIEGNMNSQEYSELNMNFIQVPYDIDKELEESKDVEDYEALYSELKYGKYRNIEKLRKILLNDGIDKM